MMTRSEPTSIHPRHRGLALPAVLGLLVIASLLCGAVAMTAGASYRAAALHHAKTKEDWALGAGVNRAVHAVVTPGDPMREALFSGRTARWVFLGQTLDLRLEVESRKLDVNAADPELILATLSRLTGASDPLLSEARQRLQAARASHATLIEPEMLLPLDRRRGRLARDVRHALTALTGQPVPAAPPGGGLDDGGAPNTPPVGSATVYAPERPIYRLVAARHDADDRASDNAPQRDVTIMLGANDSRAFRIVDGHL